MWGGRAVCRAGTRAAAARGEWKVPGSEEITEQKSLLPQRARNKNTELGRTWSSL